MVSEEAMEVILLYDRNMLYFLLCCSMRMAEKKLYFQLELDSSSAYQFSKAIGSNVKKAGILCHSGVTAGCPVAGQAGTAHRCRG
jgi:hypothetical protein